MTTGAVAALASLAAGGVDTCFANPGTSEMHFVAALDAVPEVRPVLTLFEGVATGAADGFGRMRAEPAAVLLHLGPGYGNGLANLHNARRARTPMVVVVGDHATYHKRLDAPLESDIDALAGTVSCWVRRSWRPADVGADVAAAITAARTAPGGIATLVLPADASWGEGGVPVAAAPPGPPTPVPDEAVAAAAAALRDGPRTVVLAGGPVLADRAALDALAAVVEHTGARLICETHPARALRGAGVPVVPRLGYFAEQAEAQLQGAEHLVLVGAVRPVTFFAYPGRPSDLVPEGCALHVLAAPGDDAPGAVAAVAALLGAPARPSTAPPASRPPAPSGPLTAETVAASIGSLLPEGAIVVDEAITAGGGVARALGGAPAHDVLALTGGAIGFGLPTGVGAAVACPDRPVVCLQADGSAMYTLSALWTMARERLDTTVVVYDNRSYAILGIELDRVRAGGSGPVAAGLLDIGRPDLDFATIAAGMGVPAERVTTAEACHAALERAFAEPGPHLVDAVI